MHVAFAQAGTADADEAGFLEQLRKSRAAAVAHAGFEASDHLIKNHRDRTTIWDAGFNSFGDQLGQAIGIDPHVRDSDRGFCVGALEVTLAGTGGHSSERSHATI